MFRKKRVYADAAAATPLSRRARRELIRLLGVFGNAGALHSEALEAKKELEKARRSIAESIGAHADEILFTASGTEANNLALQGVLRPLLLASRKLSAPGEMNGSPTPSAETSALPHAITIAIEHQSVLEPLRALEREGLEVSEVGVDEQGLAFPNAILSAVRPNTALVSVQLVNSEVGTIEPVLQIAKDIRSRVSRSEGKTWPSGPERPSGRNTAKVYVHTDASQAPLWMDINVEKLGVDLMTLDGQKVLGPKGIGALYVRRGTPLSPILWGGKQEQGLRGGTENVPQAGAFALALSDSQRGVERRAKHTSSIRDYVWSEIKKAIPDAILNGPPSGHARVANNLNLSVPGLDAEMAVVSMDSLGVAVSTRSACTVGSQEPSHVIQALGVPQELAGTAIRITLLPDASKSDARRIAAALAQTAGRYRRS